MKVGVVGGGISGLGAAYELAKAGVHVVLYEKEDYIGGHARTCLLYTSPSPRDGLLSRMPSSA